MTECIQSRFEFAGPGRRQVVAQFNGGVMSSDGGALLLHRTDQRLNLLPRAASCFDDHRDPLLIKHPVEELLAQRVYGLALGSTCCRAPPPASTKISAITINCGTIRCWVW